MDEHLPKPLTLDSLAEVLARMQGSSAAAGRPPTGERVAAGGSVAAWGGISSFLDRVEKLMKAMPRERIQPLLSGYLESGRRTIEQLRDAARREDCGATSALAHGFRGASCLFGTDRMVELTETLENLASTGSLEGGAALVDELQGELRRVVHFVKSGGLGKLGLG